MKTILKLSFDDKKGINCNACMLNRIINSKNRCTALGNLPFCAEDGCRKDCPLIKEDDSKEFQKVTLNTPWGENIHFKNKQDCINWIAMYLSEKIGVPQEDLEVYTNKFFTGYVAHGL